MIHKILQKEKWFETDNIFTRGYCFDSENRFYSGEKLSSFFSTVNNENDFCKLLKNITGVFSVIISCNNNLLAASDKSRVYPLFYSLDNEDINISDNPYSLLTGKNTVNSDAEGEFLLSSFTLDEKTLIDGIFQIKPLCYLYSENGKIAQKSYYSYCIENEQISLSKNTNENFSAILENVFKRLITSVNGRQIVVPLSGGYDSRLIATMLKKLDYQNVICYTVGRTNSPEHRIASLVAEKLACPCHFIFTGNKKLIDNYINDNTFQHYYKFSGSLFSSFWMYEYFGVKYLIDNDLIDKNAVFVPGHSGDFLAGSQSTKCGVKEDNSKHELLNKLSKHLCLFGKPDKNFLAKLSQIIDFKENAVSTSVFDDVIMKTQLTKRINNSTRLYEFFDCDVRLPFWDDEMIEFFRTLPPEQKINKKFYNIFLQNNLFKTFNLNFSDEMQSSNTEIKIQILKNRIKKLIPKMLLNRLLSQQDYTCMKEISAPLLADLQKQNIPLQTGRLNEVFSKWYLAKIKNTLLK
jgi:asparagine synthase (glutamine-hydrolysing)